MQTAHLSNGYNLRAGKLTVNENKMDIGIIAAVVMLIVWAVVTFSGDAPGYVHLLLTIGCFVLFWRIIVKKDPLPPKKP